MKPGRNDLCPCGSRKKHKHCCLNAGVAAPANVTDLTWRRLREQLKGYPIAMLRFVNETYGPSALHEAWEEFMGDDGVEFDPETPLMQLFMPWFFHCWTPDPHATSVEDEALQGVIPTAAYLTAKKRRLDPLLRRYLESLLSAPFTFFEVVSCDPGAKMNLQDLMTRQEHVVTERSASQAVQRGDLLFGQLASAEGLTMLEAFNGYAIPPIEKALVIDLRARIARGNPQITFDVLREYDLELLDLFHEINDRLFNPPLPVLQNTDSDPLMFHKLVFDLKVSPQTTFDAVKHLALDEPEEILLADATRGAGNDLTHVRFAWKKRGNKRHAAWDNTVLGWIEIDGGRLTAEVNSEARAKAIRKTIEKILDDNVHYRASEIQSPEKMLAEQRAAGEDMDAEEHDKLAEDPQVREMVSEMMAKHWDHWVEQSIPMLGDCTPMEAVKYPDGREKVEAIVMQAERSASGPDSQTNPEVFRRLRERLGLSDSEK
jgi:hypothetical protein